MITIYDLLEVNEKASKEDIEKAYQKLVNEYKVDPQKTVEENHDNEFILKKLTLAYEILSNDEKRKRYDNDLAQKRAEELIKKVEIVPNLDEESNVEIKSEDKLENIPNKSNKSEKLTKEEPVKQEEKYVEEIEENDNEIEVQLTDDEKKKLKKAAEKEFKENLKKAQKAEEEYNKAYNDAYNDYLRKMGYTVKEPWTFSRVKNLIIGLLVIIITCVLIWYLPPTKALLIEIYEGNFIVKSLVDIVITIVNIIIGMFK